jgi:hypothetical protein
LLLLLFEVTLLIDYYFLYSTHLSLLMWLFGWIHNTYMYDLLHQRGCIVVSMCSLFDHSYEPVDHLLLHCTFSKVLELVWLYYSPSNFYWLFIFCFIFVIHFRQAGVINSKIYFIYYHEHCLVNLALLELIEVSYQPYFFSKWSAFGYDHPCAFEYHSLILIKYNRVQ